MFLAGMIAVVVGWNMFARWMLKRIRRKELMEAFKRQNKEEDDE